MLAIPEEIKALYQDDGIQRNIRICFPNGERADITTEDIVEEAFSFTESLCSWSSLKLGLCEANVIQFECKGIENIKGCEIEVFHEIDISSQSEAFIAEYGTVTEDVAFPYYRIPFGGFVVKSCKRQTDMNRRKVVAYSQLVDDVDDLNAVERMKMSARVLSKVDYKADLMALVVSNIKNFHKTPNDILVFDDNVWDVEMESYVLDSFASESENAMYELIAQTGTFKVYGSEMEWYRNRVFNIRYDRVANYDEVVKDILDKTVFTDALKLKPECMLWRKGSDYTYGMAPSVQFNEQYLFYPYITGLADEDRIEISLPLTISYTKKDVETLKRETLYEWTVADGGNATEYVINEDYYTQDIIYKRAKVADGSVYSCEDVDVDFGNLVTACMELNGMFGKASRNGGMAFFSINDNFKIYPSDILYPSDDLYIRTPNGGNVEPSTYIDAWYDESFTKPFEAVSVTYLNADGEEITTTHRIVDENAEGYNSVNYQTYSLSDNYLIQNGTFTDDAITAILERVASNIKDVCYMPADIDLAGMPWLETGDVVSIVTSDGTVDTIILRRTLKGILSLMDNFESQ